MIDMRDLRRVGFAAWCRVSALHLLFMCIELGVWISVGFARLWTCRVYEHAWTDVDPNGKLTNIHCERCWISMADYERDMYGMHIGTTITTKVA